MEMNRYCLISTAIASHLNLHPLLVASSITARAESLLEPVFQEKGIGRRHFYVFIYLHLKNEIFLKLSIWRTRPGNNWGISLVNVTCDDDFISSNCFSNPPAPIIYTI